MSKKLNIAVATLLDYDIEDPEDGCELPWAYRNSQHTRTTIPSFASQGGAMLILDKEMKNRGWELVCTRIYSGKSCAEYIDYKNNVSAGRFISDNGMCEAISLAAYAALSGRKWEEEHV